MPSHGPSSLRMALARAANCTGMSSAVPVLPMPLPGSQPGASTAPTSDFGGGESSSGFLGCCTPPSFLLPSKKSHAMTFNPARPGPASQQLPYSQKQAAKTDLSVEKERGTPLQGPKPYGNNCLTPKCDHNTWQNGNDPKGLHAYARDVRK